MLYIISGSISIIIGLLIGPIVIGAYDTNYDINKSSWDLREFSGVVVNHNLKEKTFDVRLNETYYKGEKKVIRFIYTPRTILIRTSTNTLGSIVYSKSESITYENLKPDVNIKLLRSKLHPKKPIATAVQIIELP